MLLFFQMEFNEKELRREISYAIKNIHGIRQVLPCFQGHSHCRECSLLNLQASWLLTARLHCQHTAPSSFIFYSFTLVFFRQLFWAKQLICLKSFNLLRKARLLSYRRNQLLFYFPSRVCSSGVPAFLKNHKFQRENFCLGIGQNFQLVLQQTCCSILLPFILNCFLK